MIFHPPHTQAELFQAKIRQEEIPAVFHLTWIDNLLSIFKLDGLQPLPADHAAGNRDKVQLTWCWPHPLFFGMKNKHLLCLIEIDPEIALSEDAVVIGSMSTAFEQHRQAGILVPRMPLDLFQRIIFGSEASRRMALAVARDYPACQQLFEVDTDFFYGRHIPAARQLQLI